MKNLIPKPVSVIPAEGAFELTIHAQIFVDSANAEVNTIGQFLATQLKAATGFGILVNMEDGAVPDGNITLKVNVADSVLGGEGYQLTISPQGIEIAAHQAAGIFYGVQTLLQLIPVEAETQNIPCKVIRDHPRFGWRGTMLDVSRHFFGVEDIKHYIDLLASYKINVLHLHLSDDQGWRIEIKSWPNLTAHGGSSAINGDLGGFYTQAQYTEIVAYAQSRYITIIPEIDLPGHTNAALASYPELNCDGVAPDLYTGAEVGFSSLCIDKEITYQFVDDVVRELAAITPGPYIHIGGDEARSTPKDAFIRFIKRAEEIVKSHGKEIIAWEEAVQSELSPDSVLQYWTDIKNAELAVEKGMHLIMSPAPRTYLDMKYDQESPLGLDWAGIVSVEKAYTWDPATEVEGLAESAILGVEAPLWSETLLTMADVEFMTFPRLPGIAEIGWSPSDGRSWDEYRKRLAAQGPRWSAIGINFYRSPEISWE